MIYCTKLIEKEKSIMSKNSFLRVVALLIVMCLLTVNAPITGFALETDGEVSIPVRTIEELYNIRDDLTAKYVLMNDIDLTSATAKGGDWDFEGRGWNPIGSDDIYAADKTFSGTFDGNGHSITGMRIDTNGSRPQGSKMINAGLFSNVSGEVKNLNLIDSTVSAYSSNGTCVGILAARNSGKISNCTVSGNSTAESPYGGYSYAGGMIGINTGIIQNCGSSVNVNVKGMTYSYAGGIAARSSSTENLVAIQNCFNKGKVYATATITGAPQGIVTERASAGGIVGQSSKGVISQCYNNGNIESIVSTSNSQYADFRAYAGGIAGESGNCSPEYQSIIESYNSGNVSAQAQYPYAGGIAGTCCEAKNCYNIGTTSASYGSTTDVGFGIALSSHSSFENCYYLSGSGRNSKGATALTAGQMKLSSMFKGFDFDTIWQQNKNAVYPYPQLQLLSQNMEDAIQEISILSLPKKLSYYCGEPIDIAGGTIQVTYVSGDAMELPLSVEMLTGYDPNRLGSQTLTVTYKEFTATFDIQVSKKPIATKILLKSMPTNSKYVQGTKFDLSGSAISVIYDNGETKVVDITDSMISGGDIYTIGKQELIISYEGLNLCIPVEVIPFEVEKIELTSLPLKLVYLEGENFDATGIILTAHYNNGEDVVVSEGYTITGYSSEPGVHTITITYLSKTVDFTVDVKSKSLLKISIAQKPYKTEYVEGQNLDLTGLIVTAIYDNGFTENITDYEYSGYSSSIGLKTIVVTYKGKSTSFLVTVKEDTTVKVCVESKRATVGSTFTVNVFVENNKGFTYLELTPVIPEQVQLISVKNGSLISDLTQGKQYVWVADGDITANGLLMTFTFTTADGIEPGDYEISFIVRGCVNYDEQNVAVTVVSGKISIVNFTYGDANGDGVINGQDIIRIKKYLANYDYETGTSSIEIGNGADANGDGVISGQDIVRLKKYLANYDYETDTSTIVLGPQK